MNSRIGTCVFMALVMLGSAGVLLAQMPGMPGMGGGSDTFIGHDGHNMDHDIILPQVAVGEHYSTSLLLLNLGNPQVMNWVPPQDLVTTGKVYIYDQNGTRLPVSINGGAPASEFSFSLNPSETSYLELSSSGPDTAGWALIDIDEPASGSNWGMMDGQTMTRGMRIMADVFYTYSGPDQPASRVGVVPSMYEMGRFATSIISVQSADDLYTGVAIVNTNSKPVTVALRLKDSSGKALASTDLALKPGGQTARFVHELFPGVLPSEFRGSLEVDSSQEGTVTMGLLVSQGILTSVPMTHYGQVRMMP